MKSDKRKIIERLKRKGLIARKDSDTLSELLALATEKNERKSEASKKNSLDLLNSQSTISKEQLIYLLENRLRIC